MAKTLFIYLDGIGYKFLKHMPFLKKLGGKGKICKVAVEPLHQMEFSIFSSQPQKKLNYWTWYYYDSENSPYSWTKIIPGFLENKLTRRFINYICVLKEFLKGNTHFLPIGEIPLKSLRNFNLTSKKSFIDKNPIEIPTLFDVLRKNKISYYAYEWPIFSTENKTGLKIMEKNDLKFLKQVLKYKQKDFLFVHLTVFDALLHKKGSKDLQIFSYLKKLDKGIEKTCNDLLKDYPGLNIFAVSDHGMIDVHESVDISKAVKDLKIIYFPDSTCLRAWGEKKEIEKLRLRLKNFPGKIYTEKNKNQCPVSFNKTYSGDLLFVVNPGFEIFPNFFNKDKLIKAMHGYDKTKKLDAFFVSNKKVTGKNKIKNMDVCPLVFKVLGVGVAGMWGGGGQFDK